MAIKITIIICSLFFAALHPLPVLAGEGRARVILSSCVRWFNEIRERPRARFHAYEEARDTRLQEVFPDALSVVAARLAAGRQLNHTPEQIARFRELVDTYFDFRIQRQGYEDMARFRAWLEKTYGQPYPPADSLDIRAWATDNLTVDSLIMRHYRAYQEDRYDVATGAGGILPDGLGARSIGRRVAVKGAEYAQEAGRGFLNIAKQFAIGIATAVLGTAGLTGNLAFVTEIPGEVQRRIRAFFINQDALNAVHRSAYRVIDEYRAETFTNDDEGFQRWTILETRLRGHISDISREAANIRQDPTLPAAATEARRELRSRFEETFNNLLLVQSEKENLVRIQQRISAGSGEGAATTNAQLRDQIEYLDSVISMTRQKLAEQLASWRLSNLFHRGYHSGRSNNPEQELETDNVILNQQIARIRQLGLFAEFNTSFGNQLHSWRQQSLRLGLGQ